MYLGIVYGVSEQGVQKSVNKTLSQVDVGGVSVTPLYSSLGPSFNAPALASLCRRWQDRFLVAVLIFTSR